MKYKLRIENGTIKVKVLSGQATSTNGGVVTIIDAVTDEVITTINAGDNYYVLQFSGIDGGMADTTFTNNIVAQ